MKILLIRLVLKYSAPKTAENRERIGMKQDRREGAFSFFFVLVWI